MFDAVVQEIDIPTGLVLFQWDSLDHVPLSYSYSHLPQQRVLAVRLLPRQLGRARR